MLSKDNGYKYDVTTKIAVHNFINNLCLWRSTHTNRQGHKDKMDKETASISSGDGIEIFVRGF